MKTTLITGGSSGIGLELARKFAADGHHLIIVALLQRELEYCKSLLKKDYPNIEIFILEKDLCLFNSAMEVYNFAKLNGFEVDVLVNNAGFGTYGFVKDIDLEQEMRMIQLNVMASYQLTRLFMDDMIARKKGKILNISSISAFQPNPLLATYGATKAFVHSFSRAVNFELKKQDIGVQVTTVCPSPVDDTNFKEGAGMEKSKLFNSWMSVTAKKVAEDAYKALQSGDEFVVPKYSLHLLNKLVSRLPMGMRMSLAYNNLVE